MSTEPVLSNEQVLELARRYAPGATAVTRVFEDGYDHVVYCVDDALVVKVPRPAAQPVLLQREALILTELAGTPGLPIARLIGGEVGADGAEPHICMGLVDGKQLESLPDLEDKERRRLLRQVGHALAVLHRQPIGPFLSSAMFDVASTWGEYVSRSLRRDWERGRNKFLELGLLTAEDSQRLEAAYEQGEKGLPAWPRVVLLHNDIRPAHVLVGLNTSDLAAIIDFGDASLGPPEMEFYIMWLRWWNKREDVEQVLQSYVAEADPGPTFLETVRFVRMIAAMRNADGRWCKPEEALAEVEGLAGGIIADRMDASRTALGPIGISTSELIDEGRQP